ncbi:MarR family winged helix-turn-helix transcriptional regulator [Nonomuraea sp. NPDC023979]|uniref:MarR family winged helix-turn-helix transcriptional regulator n=1 Tax=Nonomuraea sp. NPDC023979 TaxID=3154796 RepID=UPI0033E71CDB
MRNSPPTTVHEHGTVVGARLLTVSMTSSSSGDLGWQDAAPNLSFVVNQLTDRGYAERAVDPGDRCSRVVMRTERGREARERVIAVTLADTPFADCDPDALTRFAEILQRVLHRTGR